MMSVHFGLRRETYAFLVSLYKIYLERRRVGCSHLTSASFGDAPSVKAQTGFFASDGDIADMVWELSQKGYAVVQPGDDLFCQFVLTPEVFTLLENRFSSGIQSVLQALQLFLNLFSR